MKIVAAIATVVATTLCAFAEPSRTETQDYVGPGLGAILCPSENPLGPGIGTACFTVQPFDYKIDIEVRDVTGLPVSTVAYLVGEDGFQYAYRHFCGSISYTVGDELLPNDPSARLIIWLEDPGRACGSAANLATLGSVTATLTPKPPKP